MRSIGSLRYLLSLPERTVRAGAAALGGLLYQVAMLLLPGWFRQSRLYQAVLDRFLRVTVELVGGVQGVFPPDQVDVRQLAARKAAGNLLEVASLVAVGWSPLWLLAGAADLTGGTRTYLRALVSELRRSGALPVEADVSTVADLLDVLEGTSGLMAETIDVPPLNVGAMRASWQALQRNVEMLPGPARLAGIYTQLQQVASQEKRSPLTVSSLLALGALRAGAHMGQAYLFDYYADTLRSVMREGLVAYARRVSIPYTATVLGHFDPGRTSHTERLLGRRAGGGDEAGAKAEAV